MKPPFADGKRSRSVVHRMLFQQFQSHDGYGISLQGAASQSGRQPIFQNKELLDWGCLLMESSADIVAREDILQRDKFFKESDCIFLKKRGRSSGPENNAKQFGQVPCIYKVVPFPRANYYGRRQRGNYSSLVKTVLRKRVACKIDNDLHFAAGQYPLAGMRQCRRSAIPQQANAALKGETRLMLNVDHVSLSTQ